MAPRQVVYVVDSFVDDKKTGPFLYRTGPFLYRKDAESFVRGEIAREHGDEFVYISEYSSLDPDKIVTGLWSPNCWRLEGEASKVVFYINEVPA